MKMKIKRSDFRKIWFTSDLHIGHENVIKYDNRPFNDVSEMEKYVKEELKRKLDKDDLLIDLGDLFWKKSAKESQDFIKENIPCKFIKIIGNHDKRGVYTDYNTKLLIDGPYDLLDLQVSDTDSNRLLVLCHYPILSWNQKHRGSFMIHGHCHGGVDEVNRSTGELRVDVGWGGSLCKSLGTFLVELQNLIDYERNLEKTSSNTEE